MLKGRKNCRNIFFKYLLFELKKKKHIFVNARVQRSDMSVRMDYETEKQKKTSTELVRGSWRSSVARVQQKHYHHIV